jgi:putative hydrolase of the HAD superfamily
VGGAPLLRAVIFDLWETLIDWDRQAAAQMLVDVSALVGDDGFAERWDRDKTRYTAPIRDVLLTIGAPPESLDEICAVRLEYVRRSLRPRPGVVETLRALRERGQLVGLITVCTQDVETLWEDSQLAGLFDAEIFSSRLGVAKPDPRIYLACCEELGVAPHETVFVGDGANDELAGARRVGMEAILIHRRGEGPLWPEVTDWDGPRVTSIPEVLALTAP